ncbi:MAG: Na+/H+ antiporter subunit E [Candidatus Competibacteraceae bacterium]|nr:Na+/H+ antiporter subunit E [Candidatus Competibacteraceae bacterium]
MKPILRNILGALALLVLLTALWWALTGNRGWGFGVGALLVSLLAAWPAGSPPRRFWRLVQLPGFVGFFLWESVRGGLDVARRALTPSLPLEPCWLDYSLRLPPDRGQLLFISVVSLLPGTLSAELAGGVVTIHSLAGDAREDLIMLENRIAALYGLSLEESA